MDEMKRLGALDRMMANMPPPPEMGMEAPVDAPMDAGGEIASIASQLEAAMMSLPPDQQSAVQQAIDILRSLPAAGPQEGLGTDGLEAEAYGDIPAM